MSIHLWHMSKSSKYWYVECVDMDWCHRLWEATSNGVTNQFQSKSESKLSNSLNGWMQRSQRRYMFLWEKWQRLRDLISSKDLGVGHVVHFMDKFRAWSVTVGLNTDGKSQRVLTMVWDSVNLNRNSLERAGFTDVLQWYESEIH
jgi:hypothetical protein